jgi:L-fuconolactonase
VIDAHVHFWDGPLPWMTEAMAPLRQPFGPDDLRPLAAAHGVGGVVAVQASSSLEETRRLLALATADELVAGVVGWVDLTASDVGDVLAELRAGGHLAGVRHQVHDEPDPEWLLRADVRRGLRAVEHAGLAYDLLVRARELPAALRVARELPGLRLVIDHLGKPPIASGELEPWAGRMAPFAELEHVFCKVSGLVTEADWGRWSTAGLAPYLSRALEWFGEDRLLFGSDWPVCLLAASYGEVVQAYEPSRFGGNAGADLAPDRHLREDLRKQLEAGPVHHRVRGGDDEDLRAREVAQHGEPAALRHVARVDVAPEIPLAQARVVPERREPLVVGRLHDVREAEPDVRYSRPAIELPRHLLGDQLRERVAELRIGGVLLVDRRVRGALTLEREAEDGLARRPDHAAEAEEGPRAEDVVGAHRVDPERDLVGAQSRCRNRGQVDDGLRAAQRLHGLSEVGQVGLKLLARQVRRPREVDAQHVLPQADQIAHDGPSGLSASARDDDASH